MPDNLPILYLDIDGVLLRRRHTGMFDGFELAPHCLDFLIWATSRFRCRWLSMRCRSGFLDGSRRAFRAAGAPLDDPRWGMLNLIEPAAWRVEKTEAIDSKSDFWWLDDDPSEHDRDWLRVHGREDRLIEISADRDPDALLRTRDRASLALGGGPADRGGMILPIAEIPTTEGHSILTLFAPGGAQRSGFHVTHGRVPSCW